MYKKTERNNILAPEILEQGDTIGIAAPASPFDKGSLKKGIDVLKSMGFNAYVPEGVFARQGYLAGTDDHRASLLNNLFSEKSIKAILCARGGFGSLRILSKLNYDVIRDNPKMVVGYSDVTALLSALFIKCGMVSLHGPMAAELGNISRKTRKALYSALTSRSDFDIFPVKGIPLKEARGAGLFLGGNLSTLCHLVGTPYFPGLDGNILFIEERGEALYRIDRMLTQMKTAGCFSGISGLVLGSFTGCGPARTVNRLVAGLFENIDIPILSGFSFGHGRENIAVPFGLKATLDTGSKSLFFEWPAA
jgi:muramoyltetrapeptide carboxypeptidase